jgi:curved DNA-binding protein CbpA
MLNPMDSDYYNLFGLDERADPATIKKTYYALCKRYHPDVQGDMAMMVFINRAYEVLSDPIRRAAYDYGRVIARRESVADLLNDVYSYKPKARPAYVPEHLRRQKTRLWVWMTNVGMASAA